MAVDSILKNSFPGTAILIKLAMKRRDQSLTKQIARREEGFSLYFAGANKERGPKGTRQTADFRQPNSSVKSKRVFTRTQPISVPHSTPIDPPLNKWKLRIREPDANADEKSVPEIKVIPQMESKPEEVKVISEDKLKVPETVIEPPKNKPEKTSTSENHQSRISFISKHLALLEQNDTLLDQVVSFLELQLSKNVKESEVQEQTPETKMMTEASGSETKPKQSSPKKISAIIDEWDTYGSTYEPQPSQPIQQPKSQLSAILSLASIEDQELRMGSKGSQQKHDSEDQKINDFCCTSVESLSNVRLSANKRSERKTRRNHDYFHDENISPNNELRSITEGSRFNSAKSGDNMVKRHFRIRGVNSGNIKDNSENVPEYTELHHQKTASVLRYYEGQENDFSKINQNDSEGLHFPKEGLRPVVVNKLRPPRY